MPVAPTIIPAFTSNQISLLNAELAAETASTSNLLACTSTGVLSRIGLAINNLILASQRTGLGGKTVLELEQDPAIDKGGDIGEHGIRVGDIVRVGQQPKGGERKKEKAEIKDAGVEGVVIRIGGKVVQIAVGGDEEVDGLGGRIWV